MKNKDQHSYLVSLTIRHPRKSLKDISALIKLPFSKGSGNKGDKTLGNRKTKYTVWFYAIDAKKHPTLDRCVEKLISLLNRSSLKASRPIPRDWDAYLDIAVLYKTYTCSVKIQAKHLRWFSERNIGLYVSCYPTSD